MLGQAEQKLSRIALKVPQIPGIKRGDVSYVYKNKSLPVMQSGKHKAQATVFPFNPGNFQKYF